MRRISYTVNKETAGKTLSYIFTDVMHLSGYLIRRNKHIHDAVQVNGVHADVNTVVREMDVVSVLLSDVERKSNVIPTPGNLDIIYEDEDIIALNKTAGVAVHPDHAHVDNTLGNYLIDYYIKKGDPADFHPVQRLDIGTSGLIVFAKHPYAQKVLSEEISNGSFVRKYMALCVGNIDEDTALIDKPISRPDPDSIKRCVDESGLGAVTEYQVIDRYNGMTMVKLVLHTGRTHQIRVHMSYIGHPLTGDTLYGGTATEYLTRPALHSYGAEFQHPLTGEKMCLTAPLPDDIRNQINSLNI